MAKVLRVITRLNIGGPAIHAILLSSGLNKDSFKDILICGKASESEGDMTYLAKSGSWLVSGQIISSISAFLLSVIFANLLDKQSFGTYQSDFLECIF